MAADLPETAAAARLRLVEEHVLAEVEHDLDKIMQTWGASPRLDDEGWHEHHAGHGEIRAFYDEILRALPDLTIDVERRHVTDDAVILEVVVRGTHTGTWRGLPPFGRRIESRVCAVYTFDERGMLASETGYYDRATVLRQLGVFHEPDTALGRAIAVVTPPFVVLRAYARNLLRRRSGTARPR
jgi:steroid delta-isomerase-like uncharacterized protein